MRIKRSDSSGFTLLEVLIAVTIMTIAFSAILTSESGSIFHAIRAKELTIGGWLLHRSMVESEQLYEGKPFNELPKKKTDRFPPPYENYSWTREVLEVKFPDFGTGGKNGEDQNQGKTDIQALLTKILTKYFKEAVRELVVTISWQKGNAKEQLVLSTYLVDFNTELKLAL